MEQRRRHPYDGRRERVAHADIEFQFKDAALEGRLVCRRSSGRGRQQQRVAQREASVLANRGALNAKNATGGAHPAR